MIRPISALAGDASLSGVRETQKPAANRRHGGWHSNSGIFPASLFKAYDFESGMNFLVDTGSQISILPASKWDRENRSRGQELMAANGSTIEMFGQRCLSLRFGKQKFEWTFIIAEVTQPIIGVDFLCAHLLMVDVKGRCW